MADRIFPLDRRELVAGIGRRSPKSGVAFPAQSEPLPTLALHAKTDISAASTKRWMPCCGQSKFAPDDVGRIKRGDSLRFAFLNEYRSRQN